ncbi:MAG: DUF2827 family protein [Proteobacteria bacterium]|nr:DUF2827 family protein [Pseudomonadota bacterium]
MIIYGHMTFKIGITFDPPDTPMGMFNNGVRQNALYLAELLMNMEYDVHLIVQKDKMVKVKGLVGFDERLSCSNHESMHEDNYDIIIQVGFQLLRSDFENLKQTKSKLVYYNCGSNYVIDMEHFLFGTTVVEPLYSQLVDMHPVFDQVWSIPQMEMNRSYYETLYRTEVKIVPFIWSHAATDHLQKISPDSLLYRVKNTPMKAAIFEPNLNVVKWSFPALLVCENAYRKDKCLGHVYITNMPKSKEDETRHARQFTKLVKSIDLFNDKKISVESRYSTLLCKDIGYYYEDFDYKMGGEVLSEAVRNHDGDKGYLERQRALIDRYLPTNRALQDAYRKLIEDLLG